MKTRTLFYSTTYFFIFIAINIVFFGVAFASGLIAFVGVNVLPMDRNQVLYNQTVIIENGVIKSIAGQGTIQLPKDVSVIVSDGKFLVPGLIDMHVHIGFTLENNGVEHVPEVKLRSITEDEVFLFVAHGITTVRNMQGEKYHLELRDRIKNGDLLGPRIYTAGPMVDGAPPVWPNKSMVLSPGMNVIEFLTAYMAKGYDFVKVYSNLSDQMYVALLIESQRLGIPVIGHIPRSSNIQKALLYGQETIDHLQGLDRVMQPDDAPSAPGYFAYRDWVTIDKSKMAQLAKQVAESGVSITPTLTVFDGFVSEDTVLAVLQWPGMEYVSYLRKEVWQRSPLHVRVPATIRDTIHSGQNNRFLMTKKLHEAGVPLMLGTDAGVSFMVPGQSAYNELNNMIGLGLTPYEALKSATVTPGARLGFENKLGVIKEGAMADLVLLDRNPLDDINAFSQLGGVMLNGKWLSRTEIDKRLAEIKLRNR